ncbi:efflux RND transporter periplasmic adaptor subunit [candidate division KSB1 bacterium]|nr:efflux RND transporter periplasmic adaptor subunit [candidate division KSB1 bacterium]
MAKSKKKVIWGLVILVVIVALVAVQLSKGRENYIDVTTAEVKRGHITKTVSGSGTIQPEIDVDISARISGEIISIHVEEGDLVKKGQLLVELDRQRCEASVEQAESQLLSAKANLKKSEADYKRNSDLFEQKLSSQADLDAIEAQKLSAQSQVQQASAYLKQARDDLAKTRLVSPINGTVTKLFKETGEIAVGSEFQADPIMTVSDLNLIEVLTEIDENDVVNVELGDSAKIEVDALPDTNFIGLVSEIAHSATIRNRGTQEQVTNFEVKIAVLNPGDKLRPGMSSTVDISTETHKNCLYVPIQCVTVRDVSAKTDSSADAEADNAETDSTADVSESESEKELKEVVFVVNDGKATQVQVEIGISDDTNIEIKSGLEEGQKVVSGSYRVLSKDLKDGSAVKDKKAEKKQDEEKSE